VSELESKAYARRNKIVLSGYTVPEEYRYKWEAFTENDRNQARITLYQERDEIAELYQENRKITKHYEKCVGEIQKDVIQNEYIPEMIKKGLLSRDGKTPLNNINDIACFLADNGQKVTTRLLLDLRLQKDDGKLYTRRACEYATNLANTDENQNSKKLPQDALISRKRKKST